MTVKLKDIWQFDADEEQKNGISKEVAMWKAEVYGSLPHQSMDGKDEKYTQFINAIKTDVNAVKTANHVFDTSQWLIQHGYITTTKNWHTFGITKKGVDVGVFNHLNLFKIPCSKKSLQAMVDRPEINSELRKTKDVFYDGAKEHLSDFDCELKEITIDDVDEETKQAVQNAVRNLRPHEIK